MTGIRLAFPKGIVVVLLTTMFCGCGQKGPAMGRVTGVATYDGKPLAAANVMFVPVQGGRPATATTDEQGRFTLTTFTTNDGAQVGQHRVAIVKLEASAPGEPQAHDAPMVPAIPGIPTSAARPASEIPARYGKATTSGLSTTVVAGDNQPTFDLTP